MPTYRRSIISCTHTLSFWRYRILQMLAAIEGRLEELFETIESLPTERVEAAEKVTRVRVSSVPLFWLQSKEVINSLTSQCAVDTDCFYVSTL